MMGVMSEHQAQNKAWPWASHVGWHGLEGEAWLSVLWDLAGSSAWLGSVQGL